PDRPWPPSSPSCLALPPSLRVVDALAERRSWALRLLLEELANRLVHQLQRGSFALCERAARKRSPQCPRQRSPRLFHVAFGIRSFLRHHRSHLFRRSFACSSFDATMTLKIHPANQMTEAILCAPRPIPTQSRHRSMNRTSGDALAWSLPVFRNSPSSDRSQMYASSKCLRMFGSVMGISDPNGGFVITTSIDPSSAVFFADSTPVRWPSGNSSEFM